MFKKIKSVKIYLSYRMTGAEAWACLTLLLKAAKLHLAITVWHRQENKTVLLYYSSVRETPFPAHFRVLYL